MFVCQRLLSGVLLAICCIVSFAHAGKGKDKDKEEKIVVIHCVNSEDVENIQGQFLTKVTPERSEPGWFTPIKNKDKSRDSFKIEDRYQNSDTSYFLSSGEVEGFQLSEEEKTQAFAVTPVALLKEQGSCRVKNTAKNKIWFKKVISQFLNSDHYWQIFQYEPRKTSAEATKYIVTKSPKKNAGILQLKKPEKHISLNSYQTKKVTKEIRT